MSRKVQPNSPHAARQASVHVKKRALNYKMSQPLLALTKWRPSVLPLTVKRAEMWFFTILHTILVVCVKTDITEQLFGFKTDVSGIDLPFNAIAVSSTLMGFMLIFFNNQTYSRYMGYYNACTGIGGVMQEISEQTSTHLCDLPSIRWDVNRYAMTSALLVYFKVTDPPGSTPVVDDEEWERLTSSEEAWQGIDARTKGGLANLDSRNGHWGSPALLTEAEKQVLKSKKGVLPSLMLQTWAMRAAREGYKKAGVEAPIYTQLQSSIMDLRRHCAYITNNLALPIPFPYYHALVALMMINFTLYCVAFLLLQSWISPVPMFLVTLITTGVREVSCALANPFGDDEVDFPVQKYIADLRALVSTMCNNFSGSRRSTRCSPSRSPAPSRRSRRRPSAGAGSTRWRSRRTSRRSTRWRTTRWRTTRWRTTSSGTSNSRCTRRCAGAGTRASACRSTRQLCRLR